MKYYLWLGVQGIPVSKARPYADEPERIAEESRPPARAAVLRAGHQGGAAATLPAGRGGIRRGPMATGIETRFTPALHPAAVLIRIKVFRPGSGFSK